MFKKIFNCLLFVAILILICFIFNRDSQTLNHIFNRGTILEYSIPNNIKIDEEKINASLIKLNVKYSQIEEEEETEFVQFDSDTKKIEKSLYVAVSLLSNEKRSATFNKITKEVINICPSAKLVQVLPLGHSFNDKYYNFLNILALLIVTTIIWSIVTFLYTGEKYVFIFFKNIKISLKDLINKTKEKGFGFFLKKVLLDDYDEENPAKTNITKEIISTIVFVVISLIIIRTFIGELRWIPSGSMRPTLLEKDRVYVEKLEYPHKDVNRGDILVFYPPSTNLSSNIIKAFSRLTGIFCKDMAYIKRVIGMPGDKFEIKYFPEIDEFRVYINDTALDEPYINSKSNWTVCNETMHCGPFIIPENQYFMMGDNRGNSLDSRFWGFLNKDRIIGRADVIFWPFSRINNLRYTKLKLIKENSGQKDTEFEYILNEYQY